MMVQMDFYIGLDQDLAAAKDVVAEALTSSRYFSTARPWAVNVSQVMQDSYLALRLRAKVPSLAFLHTVVFPADADVLDQDVADHRAVVVTALEHPGETLLLIREGGQDLAGAGLAQAVVEQLETQSLAPQVLSAQPVVDGQHTVPKLVQVDIEDAVAGADDLLHAVLLSVVLGWPRQIQVQFR